MSSQSRQQHNRIHIIVSIECEVNAVRVIEVRNAELLDAIASGAADCGIDNAAIVSLIGAVDSFTVSTMPAADATADTLADYQLPAEMSGTGEIVDGPVHIHAVMAVEGDKAVPGDLDGGEPSRWFYGNEWSYTGPGHGIPVEQAREAAREFVRTGQQPASPGWVEEA